MPLRLNVGVSRKLGLPEYSSVGASCNVEVELDAGLLQNDLEGFHVQVRGAFIAAQQAVNEELGRLQAQAAPPVARIAQTNGRDGRNGTAIIPNRTLARSDGARVRVTKPATPSQVKAIYAIARNQHADLEGLLSEEYGVGRPEDLALPEASEFIDRLRGVATG